MTDVKIYVQRMYVGFVYIHWAERENIKLGTAKQKSIQQIKSFSNTLDKSNPIAGEIKSNVQQMSRDVARQIMTDKSSEMTLDAGKLPQYRAFGERQVAAAKSALGAQMTRGNVAQANAGQNNTVQKSHTTKRPTISQVRDTQNASRTQDMLAKQNAPQYRAHKTNVPGNAKPAATLQKLDQKKLLQMFAYNKYQKAA